MAGLNVRFGSVDPAVKRSQTITLPDGEKMTLEPAQRVRYRLGLKNFGPLHHPAQQRFVGRRAGHSGRVA